MFLEVYSSNHLSCAVIRGSGHIGVIRGETAVVDWLIVAEHGVLGRWLVEVPQLHREAKRKKMKR